MKIRVISSVAALVLLVVIMFLGSEALGAAVFILALIGLHEFYRALENGGYKPVKSIGYLVVSRLIVFELQGQNQLKRVYFSIYYV